jgi:hypothetical protein
VLAGYHCWFFIKIDSDIRNRCRFRKPAQLIPFTAGSQRKTDSDISAGGLLPQITTVIEKWLAPGWGVYED